MQFDHYTFIRDYINPLFVLNQQYIRDYKVISYNLNDYTLNNDANSIFDKDLYTGQNALGIYSGITDAKAITQLKALGKMLFYDPILSGNNERSCVSCHKPTEFFTDTSVSTSLSFDRASSLPRNTPSLINVTHNHLLMLDGKQINLQNQARTVITNPVEMCGAEDQVLKKVLSCKEYKEAFEQLKKYTYKYKEVTFDHIISAITAYVGDFSNFTAPFDDAMNKKKEISVECKNGFNLFMGKAQCGTCHYVPEFNGVRPPYVESEFEVIGVPTDKKYSALSTDSGRADVYFSGEMLNAFRTNTVRNSSYTKPYMHNGVFNTMQEVLDFYNAGGGAGKGLKVKNQTLSSRQLNLSKEEMADLLTFIKSLDENVPVELPPDHLPLSSDKKLNDRKIGGVY
jgi:cytochrome c peroxidase